MNIVKEDTVTISLEKYEEMKSEIEKWKKAYNEKPQNATVEPTIVSIVKVAALIVCGSVFMILMLKGCTQL